MRCCPALALASLLLFSPAVTAAQDVAANSSGDGAFWVNHWARPRVTLYGAEEEEFYKNMQDILFPWNDHDTASNPNALDSNAQWLKDHPNVSFYVQGYSSSRGELLYNLSLSRRRAEWVKRELVNRGVPENRIVMAVGWGQLYPVCLELNDACWSKNRLVRFDYSPGGH